MTNEEVKQQAIKNAYGEYWDICNPDENGWTFYQLNDNKEIINGFAINSIIDCEFNNFKQDNAKLIFFVRPLSLQGIDNNNGWIRIESENDLPKYDCDCFVKIKQLKEPFICRFIFETSDFIETMIYTEDVTHWQPIITPKPPIY